MHLFKRLTYHWFFLRRRDLINKLLLIRKHRTNEHQERFLINHRFTPIQAHQIPRLSRFVVLFLRIEHVQHFEYSLNLVKREHFIFLRIIEPECILVFSVKDGVANNGWFEVCFWKSRGRTAKNFVDFVGFFDAFTGFSNFSVCF